jgi:hypothetical protein
MGYTIAMKKILLSLALLSTPYPHLFAGDHSNTVPGLSWSEYFYLNNLYATSQQDPYFIARISNQNIDYYLNLLEKKIKIIEHKICIQESAWQSTDIKIGLGLTTLLSASFFGIIIYPILQQFFTSKYHKAEIPVSMLKALSSLKFTRSERKNLDTVTVDKMVFIYKNLSEKAIYPTIIDRLTDADVKKIDYLSKRLAVKKAKVDILTGGGSWALLTPAMAFMPIYNALYYSEYLETRLRENKLLYDLLYEEKNKRT